jgi:hypothetical protein
MSFGEVTTNSTGALAVERGRLRTGDLISIVFLHLVCALWAVPTYFCGCARGHAVDIVRNGLPGLVGWLPRFARSSQL